LGDAEAYAYKDGVWGSDDAIHRASY